MCAPGQSDRLPKLSDEERARLIAERVRLDRLIRKREANRAARRSLIAERAAALAEELAERVRLARQREADAIAEAICADIRAAGGRSATDRTEPVVYRVSRPRRVAAMTRRRSPSWPAEGDVDDVAPTVREPDPLEQAVEEERRADPPGVVRLKKPAGWRFFDDTYWQKGDLLKCQFCGKQSGKPAPPGAQHSHLCPLRSRPLLAVAAVAGKPPVVALPGLSKPVLPGVPPPPRRGLPQRQGKPKKPCHFEALLIFVRRRDCAWCERVGPSHAHHQGPRGHGQKTSDLRILPLCESVPAIDHVGCHDLFHREQRLGSMTPKETRMWMNEQILIVHDEFFGFWILAGEPPVSAQEVADERLAACLDEALP